MNLPRCYGGIDLYSQMRLLTVSAAPDITAYAAYCMKRKRHSKRRNRQYHNK